MNDSKKIEILEAALKKIIHGDRKNSSENIARQALEQIKESTNFDLIFNYLKKHGPASAAYLERELNLTKGKVWYALKRNKCFSQQQNANWYVCTSNIQEPST